MRPKECRATSQNLSLSALVSAIISSAAVEIAGGLLEQPVKVEVEGDFDGFLPMPSQKILLLGKPMGLCDFPFSEGSERLT